MVINAPALGSGQGDNMTFKNRLLVSSLFLIAGVQAQACVIVSDSAGQVGYSSGTVIVSDSKGQVGYGSGGDCSPEILGAALLLLF